MNRMETYCLEVWDERGSRSSNLNEKLKKADWRRLVASRKPFNAVSPGLESRARRGSLQFRQAAGRRSSVSIA
jgi:hypothetical protein